MSAVGSPRDLVLQRYCKAPSEEVASDTTASCLSRLGNVPIPEQPPELTDRRPASTVPAVLAPGKLMSHWYVRKPRGTKFDDVSPFVRLLGQFIITNGMYQ